MPKAPRLLVVPVEEVGAEINERVVAAARRTAEVAQQLVGRRRQLIFTWTYVYNVSDSDQNSFRANDISRSALRLDLPTYTVTRGFWPVYLGTLTRETVRFNPPPAAPLLMIYRENPRKGLSIRKSFYRFSIFKNAACFGTAKTK